MNATRASAEPARIRPFHLMTDLQVLVSFQEDLYTRNFPNFRCTEEFLWDVSTKLRKAARDTRHNGVFVAELGGKIVGFVWVTIWSDYSTTWGNIDQLYVLPRWEGQGVGRSLMRTAEVFLRQRGITRMKLVVTKSNTRAVKLYQDLGFETIRYEMAKNIK